MSSDKNLSSFLCSITLEYAYDPVVLLCGHLFDRPAIRSWLLRHSSCPVCRAEAHLREFISVRAISAHFVLHGVSRPVETPPPVPSRSPIVPTAPNAPDHATAELPPFFPVDVENAPTAPVIDEDHQTLTNLIRGVIASYGDDLAVDYTSYDQVHHLHPVAGRQISGEVSTYVPESSFPRMVTMSAAFCLNTRSSNYGLLLRHVRPSNVEFIERNRLFATIVQINRYIYHYRGNLVTAMRSAAENGYFVYDFFQLTPNRFMIYTLSYRSDASIHGLMSFRLYQQRQDAIANRLSPQ
jgi:hypothetical protein